MTGRPGKMKRRQYRRQIKRRRETWWWHYLPLHQGKPSAAIWGPPLIRRMALLCAVDPVQGDLPGVDPSDDGSRPSAAAHR